MAEDGLFAAEVFSTLMFVRSSRFGVSGTVAMFGASREHTHTCCLRH